MVWFLEVFTVLFNQDHEVNEESGNVWSIPFEAIDPTAADDNFIYIKK